MMYGVKTAARFCSRKHRMPRVFMRTAQRAGLEVEDSFLVGKEGKETEVCTEQL